MSQLTWCGPSSRSTSFMAVKMGRSGQPVQNEGGRGWTSRSTCERGGRRGPDDRRQMLAVDAARRVALDELQDALDDHGGGVLAGHGQQVLAVDCCVDAGLAQDGVEVLLDEIGLAFFDQQHGALAGAESQDLVVHQRVGHVQDVERHLAVAERVGEPEQFQRADWPCCTCRPAG